MLDQIKLVVFFDEGAHISHTKSNFFKKKFYRKKFNKNYKPKVKFFIKVERLVIRLIFL